MPTAKIRQDLFTDGEIIIKRRSWVGFPVYAFLAGMSLLYGGAKLGHFELGDSTLVTYLTDAGLMSLVILIFFIVTGFFDLTPLREWRVMSNEKNKVERKIYAKVQEIITLRQQLDLLEKDHKASVEALKKNHYHRTTEYEIDIDFWDWSNWFYRRHPDIPPPPKDWKDYLNGRKLDSSGKSTERRDSLRRHVGVPPVVNAAGSSVYVPKGLKEVAGRNIMEDGDDIDHILEIDKSKMKGSNGQEGNKAPKAERKKGFVPNETDQEYNARMKKMREDGRL